MNRTILFSIISLTIYSFSVPSEVLSQTIVFDDEIYWDWPSNSEYGGYGFYWWHKTTGGVNNVNYGDMSPTDWTTPDNYYTGEFRMRIEVLDQPTNEPFQLQFGIWQDYSKGSDHPETVCSRVSISGGTVFEGSIGSPQDWWNKEPGDRVDFSRPEDFYRIGIVLWNTDPLCIPMGHDWNTSGCPDEAYKFFPMRVRVTVTAYPGSGGPVINPPNYGIDYYNERTSKPVSSDDQYSFDNFNTVLDGTNSYVSLSLGQDIYFRKDADHSKTQTLDVPSRPSTPSFTVDFDLEQTSESISSSYEYAASSNMESAVTGDGTPLDLTPGQDTYIRRKATSSSFRSGIQTLSVPGRPSSPAIEIDYINETTGAAVDNTVEYSSESGMESPITGSGETVEVSPGTDLYFRKIATTSSFRSDIQHLTVPSRPGTPGYSINFLDEITSSPVVSGDEWATNDQMQDALEGTDTPLPVVPGQDLYFRTKATTTSFASGIQSLQVPARPDAPLFEIDYLAESTAQAVGSDVEYAYNESFNPANQGANVELGMQPGDQVYFRMSATENSFRSETSVLTAPIRPVIDSEESDTTVLDQFQVNLIFFQQVSDLDLSMVTAVNASLSDLILVSSLETSAVFKATVSPSAEGPVSLRIEADAADLGNYSSETFGIYYQEENDPTNVGDLYQPSGMHIYPNPNTGQFYISLPEEDRTEAQLKVYSSIGNEVYSVKLRLQPETFIDLEELEKGIYFVRMVAGEKEYLQKVIIQK